VLQYLRHASTMTLKLHRRPMHRDAEFHQEQTRHPMDVVARETGFANRRRMREAFLRGFGQPLQVIRRHARVEVVNYLGQSGNSYSRAIQYPR
jgi:hypothetical protein